MRDLNPESSLVMSNLQQFLRFQIQPFDSAHDKPNLMALMEVNLVTELVNVPIDRVVPMPHLPPAVMGVYNWRGEILWIVDLAMLLGTRTSLLRTRSLQPTIIVSNAIKNEARQQRTVGLVVDEIAEIEWCDLEEIDSILPTDIHPQFSRWTSGLWQAANGESFLVLNGDKILNEADVHTAL
jgi:positive phototaxis protein PixI